MIGNVCDQIGQQLPVPKRLPEYTEEEIKNFPRLFEWYFFLIN